MRVRARPGRNENRMPARTMRRAAPHFASRTSAYAPFGWGRPGTAKHRARVRAARVCGRPTTIRACFTSAIARRAAVMERAVLLANHVIAAEPIATRAAAAHSGRAWRSAWPAGRRCCRRRRRWPCASRRPGCSSGSARQVPAPPRPAREHRCVQPAWRWEPAVAGDAPAVGDRRRCGARRRRELAHRQPALGHRRRSRAHPRPRTGRASWRARVGGGAPVCATPCVAALQGGSGVAHAAR